MDESGNKSRLARSIDLQTNKAGQSKAPGIGPSGLRQALEEESTASSLSATDLQRGQSAAEFRPEEQTEGRLSVVSTTQSGLDSGSHVGTEGQPSGLQRSAAGVVAGGSR